VRATARPVCEALLAGMRRHGVPEQILTDNGKVFTGKLARRPSNVLFDRICHDNGVRHLLTAPYSPTTTGKIERLHKTMRKECFADHSFATIEDAQSKLDAWVHRYNTEREHQAIGDVTPQTRFDLRRTRQVEIVDADPSPDVQPPLRRFVVRRVDTEGRIRILRHRYHVGRHLVGRSVEVESHDGLLHVSHNGVVVATHARRHLPEDDDRMDRRAKSARAKRPTRGEEVLRKVDGSGGVSFAGTAYRAGNAYIGQVVGVRLVGDTVQITQDGRLLRTHRVRHDPSKEFGALSKPNGKPRRRTDGVA
jgi:integrase-like protein/Mu transposase-like protein